MEAYRSFKLKKMYKSLEDISKRNKLRYVYNYKYDCMLTYEDAKKIIEINTIFDGLTKACWTLGEFDFGEYIEKEKQLALYLNEINIINKYVYERYINHGINNILWLLDHKYTSLRMKFQIENAGGS